MADNIGTLIAATIRPFSTDDTFPTVFSNDVKGGHHSVVDVATRNAIPASRREEGMLCTVLSPLKTYQLVGGIDNTNWTVYLSDEIETLQTTIIGLSSSSGGEFTNIINQITSLSGAIDNNSQGINELTSNVSFISGAIDNNSQGINELTSNVSFISGAIDNNSQGINELTSNVSFISGAIDNNSSDITYVSGAVSSNYQELKNDVMNLDTQINVLSGAIYANYQDDILQRSILQSQIDSLSGGTTNIVSMSGNLTIDNLENVDIDNATDGDILVYSQAMSAWVNEEKYSPRIEVQGTTSSLIQGASAQLNITGFKSYSLLKVSSSTDSWVRVYSDDTSRQSDIGRDELTDPLPNSGVIAEVITNGPEVIKFTPGVLGYNDENPVTDGIFLSVTNKNAITQPITVTLTLLRME